MGLDWNSPVYSGEDPAGSSAPPLPPLQVDYGSLADDLEAVNVLPEVLLERHTARLKRDPNDAQAYHLRAHALGKLSRFPEAIEAFTNAIRLRPRDAHIRSLRGIVHLELGQKEPAIDDLEAALRLDPDQRLFPKWLSEVCTARAWELATGHEHGRDLDRALVLARRAVELSPWDPVCVSTLGVTLYRAGLYSESIAILDRTIEAGRGETLACDLFFLAMAHHRLGHAELASARFELATRWMQNHADPYERRPGEPVAFGERRIGQLAAFPRRSRGRPCRPARSTPGQRFRRSAVAPAPLVGYDPVARCIVRKSAGRKRRACGQTAAPRGYHDSCARRGNHTSAKGALASTTRGDSPMATLFQRLRHGFGGRAQGRLRLVQVSAAGVWRSVSSGSKTERS